MTFFVKESWKKLLFSKTQNSSKQVKCQFTYFCGDLWRNALLCTLLSKSVNTLPPADLLQSALMHSSAICPHQTTQLVSHQPTKENLFFFQKKVYGTFSIPFNHHKSFGVSDIHISFSFSVKKINYCKWIWKPPGKLRWKNFRLFSFWQKKYFFGTVVIK